MMDIEQIESKIEEFRQMLIRCGIEHSLVILPNDSRMDTISHYQVHESRFGLLISANVKMFVDGQVRQMQLNFDNPRRIKP